MSGNDLRTLIESRIPEHRAHLETSHLNLENVAAYCEANYLNDRNASFEETKQFALQSLASVAYQINTLARDLLDMLDLQTDKISNLSGQVENIDVVNIHKEKLARREIGALTTNKTTQKQPKIIAPATQRYRRAPIDFSVLDGIGHGVRCEVGFHFIPTCWKTHFSCSPPIDNIADLPPPVMQMLNSTHEDEPLPPPPQANFFDAHADWIPRNYIEKAVALYDYDADKPDELSLRENCIVYVLRKNDDGWYEGVLDGVTGLFPGNYVQPV
ncbi:unnamed protein product [Haemonchus placei]|uniref:SH3 domain-containing protein n=1 Tax=Haemonchus placei TaxID=6290 RepID=A0A0N4WBK9_HAEPC|nr:unnamed protein product [Haemonchus placei]